MPTYDDNDYDDVDDFEDYDEDEVATPTRWGKLVQLDAAQLGSRGPCFDLDLLQNLGDFDEEIARDWTVSIQPQNWPPISQVGVARTPMVQFIGSYGAGGISAEVLVNVPWYGRVFHFVGPISQGYLEVVEQAFTQGVSLLNTAVFLAPGRPSESKDLHEFFVPPVTTEPIHPLPPFCTEFSTYLFLDLANPAPPPGTVTLDFLDSAGALIVQYFVTVQNSAFALAKYPVPSPAVAWRIDNTALVESAFGYVQFDTLR